MAKKKHKYKIGDWILSSHGLYEVVEIISKNDMYPINCYKILHLDTNKTILRNQWVVEGQTHKVPNNEATKVLYAGSK